MSFFLNKLICDHSQKCFLFFTWIWPKTKAHLPSKYIDRKGHQEKHFEYGWVILIDFYPLKLQKIYMTLTQPLIISGRAVERSENSRGRGVSSAPLVEIGLTDLSNSGGRDGPPPRTFRHPWKVENCSDIFFYLCLKDGRAFCTGLSSSIPTGYFILLSTFLTIKVHIFW